MDRIALLIVNLILISHVHSAPQHYPQQNSVYPSYFYQQLPFIYNPYPNPFYSYNYASPISGKFSNVKSESEKKTSLPDPPKVEGKSASPVILSPGTKGQSSPFVPVLQYVPAYGGYGLGGGYGGYGGGYGNYGGYGAYGAYGRNLDSWTAKEIPVTVIVDENFEKSYNVPYNNNYQNPYVRNYVEQPKQNQQIHGLVAVPQQQIHGIHSIPQQPFHDVPAPQHVVHDGPSVLQHHVQNVPSGSQHAVHDGPSGSQHHVPNVPFGSQHGVHDGPSVSQYAGHDGPSGSQHQVHDSPSVSQHQPHEGPFTQHVTHNVPSPQQQVHDVPSSGVGQGGESLTVKTSPEAAQYISVHSSPIDKSQYISGSQLIPNVAGINTPQASISFFQHYPGFSYGRDLAGWNVNEIPISAVVVDEGVADKNPEKQVEKVEEKIDDKISNASPVISSKNN